MDTECGHWQSGRKAGCLAARFFPLLPNIVMAIDMVAIAIGLAALLSPLRIQSLPEPDRSELRRSQASVGRLAVGSFWQFCKLTLQEFDEALYGMKLH